MYKRLLIICNPTAGAGRAKEALEHLEAELNSCDRNFEVYQTMGNRDYSGIESSIKQLNPELIVVIGGDGTLNDVVNALPSFDIPLHIIPAGSGNDFHQLTSHRSLNSNSDLSKELVYSDIWSCNGMLFHNGVGLGFDGSIAHQTQYSKIKWLPLGLKYWFAIFRNIFTYRSKKCVIKSEDGSYDGLSFMISVANGTQYGGGFKVAPDAQRDDGLLDVVIIHKIHPLKRLVYVPKVEKGEHMNLDIVQHFRTNNLSIEYTEEIPVHLDGEVISASRFEFKHLGQLSILP